MAWTRPSLQTIVQRIQSDIDSRLAGADSFIIRSLLYVVAKAVAAIAHGLYGHQAHTAKQIVPNKDMDSENLDRAATWLGRGMKRNDPKAANGPATALGNDGAVIPKDRLLQRSDGIEYKVDAEVSVSGGTATLSVTATTTGQNSNALEGQTLTFITPVPGVQSSVTVAAGGLTGGTDIEADPQLLARLEEFVANSANGVNLDQYVAWAKEVSGVTRVWPFDKWLGVGTVAVFFVRDDDASIFPDVAEVQAVQDYIDVRRPPGLSGFSAYAPVEAAQAMTIQLSPNTVAVQDAVTKEIADLFHRDAQVEDGNGSGTILISRINEAISIATGESDHLLVSPTANITPNQGELATPGVITFQGMA